MRIDIRNQKVVVAGSLHFALIEEMEHTLHPPEVFTPTESIPVITGGTPTVSGPDIDVEDQDDLGATLAWRREYGSTFYVTKKLQGEAAATLAFRTESGRVRVLLPSDGVWEIEVTTKSWADKYKPTGFSLPSKVLITVPRDHLTGGAIATIQMSDEPEPLSDEPEPVDDYTEFVVDETEPGLHEMTLPELKSFAKLHGVDLVKAKTKQQIIDAIEKK